MMDHFRIKALAGTDRRIAFAGARKAADGLRGLSAQPSFALGTNNTTADPFLRHNVQRGHREPNPASPLFSRYGRDGSEDAQSALQNKLIRQKLKIAAPIPCSTSLPYFITGPYKI